MKGSIALPLLLLLAILSSSSARIPTAAAGGRPLLAADGLRVEQAHVAVVVDSPVIVLPSLRRPWHKLPPLEMKPAGHSCETYSPKPPTTKTALHHHEGHEATR
ncbi:unnamed protein product [Urochloa humidicola]